MTPDIRKFNFYQNKNTFCGSYKGVNFRIIPGEEFTLELWDTPFCSALTEQKQVQHFPFSPEGFSQLSQWLGQRLEIQDRRE